MVNKKDVILSALVILCLMITLFSSMMSNQTQAKSQTQTSSEILADPWCDLNDDGKIDEDDLWTFCANFITYGITGALYPTKNVNVTNFPLDEQGNLRVNVTEKPLQIYNECIPIQLLNFEGDIQGIAQGIKLFNLLGMRQEFLFCFPPKSVFLNITDLWISGIGMAWYATYNDTWNMIINDYEMNVTVSLPAVTEFTMFKLHITDNEFYKAIKPNTTNILGILDLLNSMHLYSLTIFVEYRYQAR